MKFEKRSDTVFRTQSQSRKGMFHYISLFENPLHIALVGLKAERWVGKTMKDFKILIVCSCESFRMGIARKGDNPFLNPCVHIKAYNKTKAPGKSIAKKKIKPSGALGRTVRRETR